MKKGLTELVFIVDKSGSMAGLESDTIGGLNATLATHRETEGECIVSTVLFNERQEVLHDRVDIQKVAPLAKDDYRVGGCTALLDAVGGSIKHIDRVQGYLPAEYQAEHVIFVITTDGLENASKRYSYAEVKRVIERKQEEGWEFLFLGANIDAVAEAARIGICEDRAATYLNDPVGNRVMHEAVAEATRVMRCASARPNGSWRRAIDRDRKKRG